MITFSDLEYIVIVLALISLFIISLRKRNEDSVNTVLSIRSGGGTSALDVNMTNSMKGLACVMILMSHWGQRRFDVDMPWGISKLVWNLFANIALVWFMWSSGYGLSLKKSETQVRIDSLWFKRLKKVYLPCLFACAFCTLCYVFLPVKYDPLQSDVMWISSDIYYLHNISIPGLVEVLLHTFGWKDWYVICIIIFYSLFYFSIWLDNNSSFSQTTWLFILMCVYYVWAFFYFGREEGHFFRYCWVFFVSHVVAKWDSYTNKRYPLLFSLILCMTLLFEGKLMLWAFFFAIIAVALFSIINQYYTVDGKILLGLGSISYFFYLLHARICYTILVYLNIDSIVFWTLLSVSIASLVKFFYDKLIFSKL